MRTHSRRSSTTQWTATWLLVGADAIPDSEPAALPPPRTADQERPAEAAEGGTPAPARERRASG